MSVLSEMAEEYLRCAAPSATNWRRLTGSFLASSPTWKASAPRQ